MMMTKGTILLFHMNIFKAGALQTLCHELDLNCRVCSPEEEHIPIKRLLDGAGHTTLPSGRTHGKTALSEEMLVMCGLDEETMDLFLEKLRSGHMAVSLKAVLTPVNRTWSAVRLCGELTRERKAYEIR